MDYEKMTREEMLNLNHRRNPFAGRRYYESLTTTKLREMLVRWDNLGKTA